MYHSYLSLVMRKPFFCICENKDADQLRNNCAAVQRLCFRYMETTILLLPKFRNFKPQAIFCGCTAWFVSDLVGNPEDRFFDNEAHFRQAFQMPLAVDIGQVQHYVNVSILIKFSQKTSVFTLLISSPEPKAHR